MNFNSTSFLFFFPIVLLVYAAVRRNQKPRDFFLLCASYFFYMSWNWKYAGLIALSTVVDYCIGLRMSGNRSERARKLLGLLSELRGMKVPASTSC